MKTRHQEIIDIIVTRRMLAGDTTDPRVITLSESANLRYQEKQEQIKGLLS